MNLYQINAEYQQILDDLYDDEGNVNQDALIKLEQNEITLEKKAIAIASYIKNMEAEKTAIDSAKKSMAEREKRYKKKIDDLMGYLLAGMESRGLKSVKCPYFEIKLKECPLSVDDENTNIDLLPDEYKRVKVETSPDKIKLLQDRKLGVVIPGAAFKNNMSLTIK
jgi:hypothetical protein